MDFATARDAVRNGAAPDQAARRVVAALTPQERLWCLDGDAPTWAGLGFLGKDGYHLDTFTAARVDRVGLPGVDFADGPRGCVVGNATAFPVSMARGATWDPELEERVGDAIGRELRAAGATMTGAVCVNVLRHPAWGRAQETYGEDPHHVGELGAAFTRGLQRHVMACVKHFAANSMENARFSVDIAVEEVALHEVYLPHFRRIVEEGVAAVMTAYNAVNGEWCGQSHALVTDILRGEWGFDGFVISDWIFGLRDGATSLAAGLDIEMPYRMIRQQSLPGALAAGEASWDEVDAAVERIVATLLRFDAVLSAPAPPRELLGAPAHRALAREVAARSVVLLKNETVDGAPVLPLEPGATVAVIGRCADRVNLGDGGSSDVWDLECSTVLDGMAATFASVRHDDGSDPGRAALLAADAGAAVVVVGYTYLDEGEYIGATGDDLVGLFPAADEPDVVERFAARIADLEPTVRPAWHAERTRGFSVGGDRRSLRLDDADVALIRAVAAANPRTVVVIQAGSAVVVDEWADAVPSVLQAWYGGCQAGPGLTDVVTGTVDPSARLPFSVPHDEAHLPAFDIDATSFRYDRWHGWWHLARSGNEAAFPFGFGLSYTTFALTDSEVRLAGDALEVGATVANTGGRDGVDVVQVYVELADPDAPPRLVGFARVTVAAGAAAAVTVEVPLERLATRNPEQHRWEAPSGPHRILVARFAGDPDARTHRIDLSA
ncbi:glycoside hydrolase family 3 protein [Nodularia spumigena]|uniref:glycoside hydrolase family 3 protein n=1 Tax=Nodularia spumigena TaxID=70799 RepID=UPI002B21554C|nr:glycoside hydrolase family 3 N-terminal domain-containing protein [Nodularia spumigena]MEA5558033.1 glycoside hydrolase family 3 N-terminal domain-containing protein [Nodularia spumigena CH309]